MTRRRLRNGSPYTANFQSILEEDERWQAPNTKVGGRGRATARIVATVQHRELPNSSRFKPVALVPYTGGTRGASRELKEALDATRDDLASIEGKPAGAALKRLRAGGARKAPKARSRSRAKPRPNAGFSEYGVGITSGIGGVRRTPAVQLTRARKAGQPGALALPEIGGRS